MAKSFAYWVIVAGNTPTAFRAREQEPLLPTLRQLQRTQSNVTLSWFERNRLWASPAEAEADQQRRKTLRRERGQDWRPGGVHKDPQARVELTRDQKRARFKRQRTWPEKPATGTTAPLGGPKGPRGGSHDDGRKGPR
jgi:hypothetical protein